VRTTEAPCNNRFRRRSLRLRCAAPEDPPPVEMLATVLASFAAAPPPQAASHICVYNDVAAVISFKLRDTASGNESARSSHFPVWQTKCIVASAVGGAGSEIVPVVDAVLGKEVVGDTPVLDDPVAASTVTYVCKGTTLDFSCKIGPPGPSPADVAQEVGNFSLGFAKGLGLKAGFADCVADVEGFATGIKEAVDFFEHGFNVKSIASIVRAFELIGGLLETLGAAITDCVKDVAALVAKIKDLVAALSGSVLDVIKVVVEAALHIFHDRAEISTDCKTVAADWRANDFQGSGEALGEVIGVLISDLATNDDMSSPGQCAKAPYAYCCGVGTPCDCSKGTSSPGQCKPESYIYCCDTGTPCDCTKPGFLSAAA